MAGNKNQYGVLAEVSRGIAMEERKCRVKGRVRRKLL
jgi:hypothetical protein